MSIKRSALFGDKGIELSDYVKRGENSKHSQSFLTTLRENFKKLANLLYFIIRICSFSHVITWFNSPLTVLCWSNCVIMLYGWINIPKSHAHFFS